MIGTPFQTTAQLESMLRQVDLLLANYQSSSNKTLLVEIVKLQAQVINTLGQSAGLAASPSRMLTIQSLR